MGPGMVVNASSAVPRDSDTHPRGVLQTGSRRGRLPHFLVIGAQKAGTTALDLNLRKHPGIELVPNFRAEWKGWVNTKETHFFTGWGAQCFNLSTLDDYKAVFNNGGKIQGEVCPAYGAPVPIAAIAEAIPDVKLILICREPLCRIESAINHMMQWHAERGDLQRFSGWNPSFSFEKNLQNELADPSMFGLLRIGLYADTMDQVLRRFPREQLLVLVAEEYRQDPQATYDQIADFLAVAPAKISHKDSHVRTYTTRLTAEQRAWLSDFYKPHNQRFFELLGRDVPSWSSASVPG